MAKLCLYVIDAETNQNIDVYMGEAREDELRSTISGWQTDWTSDYIRTPSFMPYALRTEDEQLVALAVFEEQRNHFILHLPYMEAHPESNPNLTSKKRYKNIAHAVIAFGVALSANLGYGGAVTLEAKTSELLKYYVKEFHAAVLGSGGVAQAARLLIADESALRAITRFTLEMEDEDE